jgi:hypothetical protein
MPLLSRILASSAVALSGLLIAPPVPVDALVTPAGSGSELGHLAARHFAGVSPNHNALAHRKRNVHQKRKRCQQRPVPASSTPASSTTTPDPQPPNPSDNNNNNNNTGNNVSGNNNPSGTNNNNNPGNTNSGYQPPTPPPTDSGSGKLILAWPNGPDASVGQYFTGKAK